MSGGSTFIDTWGHIRPVTNKTRRKAATVLLRQAIDANATEQEMRDALEMIGVLPYTSGTVVRIR